MPLARSYERELVAELGREEFAALEHLVGQLTQRARTLAWDEDA